MINTGYDSKLLNMKAIVRGIKLRRRVYMDVDVCHVDNAFEANKLNHAIGKPTFSQEEVRLQILKEIIVGTSKQHLQNIKLFSIRVHNVKVYQWLK